MTTSTLARPDQNNTTNPSSVSRRGQWRSARDSNSHCGGVWRSGCRAPSTDCSVARHMHRCHPGAHHFGAFPRTHSAAATGRLFQPRRSLRNESLGQVRRLTPPILPEDGIWGGAQNDNCCARCNCAQPNRSLCVCGQAIVAERRHCTRKVMLRHPRDSRITLRVFTVFVTPEISEQATTACGKTEHKFWDAAAIAASGVTVRGDPFALLAGGSK